MQVNSVCGSAEVSLAPEFGFLSLPVKVKREERDDKHTSFVLYNALKCTINKA